MSSFLVLKLILLYHNSFRDQKRGHLNSTSSLVITRLAHFLISRFYVKL